MTANFYGLTFRPPGGAILNFGASWARQITATAIKRLVGTAYVPGQFEDEAIAEFGLYGEGGLSPAAEEKALKDKKPKSFDQFLFKAEAALNLVLWLRNTKHLTLRYRRVRKNCCGWDLLFRSSGRICSRPRSMAASRCPAGTRSRCSRWT